MQKIRIAFIKFGGLAAGGTEKYLQTLACNLPKDQFEVDYFYTEAVPLLGNSWKHPETNEERKKYMQDNNINLINVACEARDDRSGPPYEWLETNFWDLFDESKYDIVQTGRSGYTEFPFDRMNNSCFVDSIHGGGDQGVEKRSNIIKTVLLSKTHVDKWVSNGGEEHKVKIIPPLVEFPQKRQSHLRQQLGISDSVKVFGMHQRDCDSIFSSMPLKAYSLIENKNTAFIMLGGSKRYKNQAQQLGLNNTHFLDFTGDARKISDFVSSLDVFAHGRLDGEVCSAAIIEALYHGKPVITHPAINMGHLEQIEGCGFMVQNAAEYASVMNELIKNSELYGKLSKASSEKYKNTYSLESCIKKYVSLYKEVLGKKSHRKIK